MPLVVGVGSLAAERYRSGMALVAESVEDALLVCLQNGDHNAPTMAPDQFRRDLVEPLLQRVGAPWS